jgi:hypothetical protein
LCGEMRPDSNAVQPPFAKALGRTRIRDMSVGIRV